MSKTFLDQQKQIDTANTVWRCPALLLIDTSESVQDYVSEIKKALPQMIRRILDDEIARDNMELGVYTFNEHLQALLPLEKVHRHTERMHDLKLVCCGRKQTGKAINQAIQVLEQRISALREQKMQVYVPALIVITDGNPDESDSVNSSDEFAQACALIREKVRTKQLDVTAVGVGKHVRSDILSGIAGGNIGRSPLCIENTEAIAELFRLISVHLFANASGNLLSNEAYRENYCDVIDPDNPLMER